MLVASHRRAMGRDGNQVNDVKSMYAVKGVLVEIQGRAMIKGSIQMINVSSCDVVMKCLRRLA